MQNRGGVMVRSVVVLSGEVAAGKSTLAAGLHDMYRAYVVSSRRIIQERFKRANSPGEIDARRALQEFGERLDAQDGGAWLAADVATALDGVDAALVVIDAVRVLGQIEALRQTFGRRVWHVHLTSSDVAELAARYDERRRRGTLKELDSYAEVQANQTEAQVATLAQYADVVLDTHRNSEADVLIRCAARIGLLADLGSRLVDVDRKSVV